jgi:Ca2+-binding RTX toxin-like protein
MTQPAPQRAFLAEFLGTALLATAVVDSGSWPPGCPATMLAAAAGELDRDRVRLGALTLIFGPVSYAHFNPVVSAVENVIGGTGGDRISGNALSNNLNGADGNDVLVAVDGVRGQRCAQRTLRLRRLHLRPRRHRAELRSLTTGMISNDGGRGGRRRLPLPPRLQGATVANLSERASWPGSAGWPGVSPPRSGVGHRVLPRSRGGVRSWPCSAGPRGTPGLGRAGRSGRVHADLGGRC